MTTQGSVEIGPNDLDQNEGRDRFVGYGPAAEYLGLKRNTLSSYSARGIGPTINGYEVVDQYNMPVFLRNDLDEWKANRPGQGARTDLMAVPS